MTNVTITGNLAYEPEIRFTPTGKKVAQLVIIENRRRPADNGGWEDAAVPPQHLGTYLREFDALLERYGLHGLPYGHFGDGCVHCRIDFPLEAPDGAARYKAFVEDAARLVARFGGSMSGEHGDGRARSALLPHMYSADALRLFGAVKAIFDPRGLLNPGVLVDPDPVEANLRMVAASRSPLSSTDAEFVEAVHQCSGVGKCLANSTVSGGVMCPSFQATRDEKDSTRGRARALQEMVNGSLISQGWRSPEVAAATVEYKTSYDEFGLADWSTGG